MEIVNVNNATTIGLSYDECDMLSEDLVALLVSNDAKAKSAFAFWAAFHKWAIDDLPYLANGDGSKAYLFFGALGLGETDVLPLDHCAVMTDLPDPKNAVLERGGKPLPIQSPLDAPDIPKPSIANYFKLPRRYFRATDGEPDFVSGLSIYLKDLNANEHARKTGRAHFINGSHRGKAPVDDGWNKPTHEAVSYTDAEALMRDRKGNLNVRMGKAIGGYRLGVADLDPKNMPFADDSDRQWYLDQRKAHGAPDIRVLNYYPGCNTFKVKYVFDKGGNDEDARTVRKLDQYAAVLKILGRDAASFTHVRTGSGGLHIYFLFDSSLGIPSKSAAKLQGVDWLCDKSSPPPVAAGSVHPNGQLYTHIPNTPVVDSTGRVDPVTFRTLTDKPAIGADGKAKPTLPATEKKPRQPIDVDDETLERLVDLCEKAEFYPGTIEREQVGRDAWVACGWACFHLFGDSGEALFYAMSEPESNCEDVWASFSDDGREEKAGFNTLIEAVDAHADQLGGSIEEFPDLGALKTELQRIQSRAKVQSSRIAAIDDFEDDVDLGLVVNRPAIKQKCLQLRQSAMRTNKSGTIISDLANTLFAIQSLELLPSKNIVKGRIELQGVVPWLDESKELDTKGRVLDDTSFSLIWNRLIELYGHDGFNPSKETMRNALDGLASQRKFDPIVDWLESLQWDGVNRLDRFGPEYFNTEDTELDREQAKRFLLGLVWRAYNPGHKHDEMWVLVSAKQGWNKSSGLQALVGEDYFSDTLGNIGSKESYEQLRGKWLVEVAELTALQGKSGETVKQFLSKSADFYRDSYGAYAYDHNRRCIFAGTTNRSGELSDMTGNRRFWFSTVQAPIDVAKIESDRGQIFAEAVHLYKQGESDRLPERLWAAAGERQEAETTDHPWVDVINDFLEQRQSNYATGIKPEIGENEEGETMLGEALPPDKVHTSELFDVLGISEGSRQQWMSRQLRDIMEARFGFAHKKNVRIGPDNRAGYFKAD